MKEMNHKLSMIACVYSVVLALPPTSPVRYLPYLITLRVDVQILSAQFLRSMFFNIIVADNNNAVGFAKFFPAMSGAVPWTASYTSQSFPIFPEAVSPRPPIKPAQRSETISPYKLGITITSKSLGLLASFIQTVSICYSVYSIIGYSFAISAAIWIKSPSPIFITPALWQATIFFLPIFLAYSKAYRQIFQQADLEMIFKFSTTPGTTWCSKPEYQPYVFSLIVMMSTFSQGVFMPGILLQGRTFAQSFNFFLKVTFNDRKPLPIGVSNGPLSPYLNYCTLLIDSQEIKSPS